MYVPEVVCIRKNLNRNDCQQISGGSYFQCNLIYIIGKRCQFTTRVVYIFSSVLRKSKRMVHMFNSMTITECICQSSCRVSTADTEYIKVTLNRSTFQ